MGNTDNYQVSVCFPFVWGGGLRILEALGFDAPSGVMTQGGQLDPRLASKSIRSTWSAD